MLNITIGRHIQGSQLFDYSRAPDGFLVEHFASLVDNLRYRWFFATAVIWLVGEFGGKAGELVPNHVAMHEKRAGRSSTVEKHLFGVTRPRRMLGAHTSS
jgi:hypothetical protein